MTETWNVNVGRTDLVVDAPTDRSEWLPFARLVLQVYREKRYLNEHERLLDATELLEGWDRIVVLSRGGIPVAGCAVALGDSLQVIRSFAPEVPSATGRMELGRLVVTARPALGNGEPT